MAKPPLRFAGNRLLSPVSRRDEISLDKICQRERGIAEEHARIARVEPDGDLGVRDGLVGPAGVRRYRSETCKSEGKVRVDTQGLYERRDRLLITAQQTSENHSKGPVRILVLQVVSDGVASRPKSLVPKPVWRIGEAHKDQVISA